MRKGDPCPVCGPGQGTIAMVKPVYAPPTFGDKGARQQIETAYRCTRGHAWREAVGEKPRGRPRSS
jgi:hypothetical protein